MLHCQARILLPEELALGPCWRRSCERLVCQGREQHTDSAAVAGLQVCSLQPCQVLAGSSGLSQDAVQLGALQAAGLLL